MIAAPDGARAGLSDAARAALMLIALPIVVLVVGADANRRRHVRHGDDAAVLAVAARLPSSDLALSGGARWLRFPSLEDPGAAFADAPALPDPDPAGGMIAPPTILWTNVDTNTTKATTATPATAGAARK